MWHVYANVKYGAGIHIIIMDDIMQYKLKKS